MKWPCNASFPLFLFSSFPLSPVDADINAEAVSSSHWRNLREPNRPR